MDTSSALAVTTCIGSILLPAGHRMRAARCLICEDLIAGRPVTIIGIAALDGDACKCGSVISDAYLCHAEHLPVATEMLQQAIQTALTCTLDHSAHW